MSLPTISSFDLRGEWENRGTKASRRAPITTRENAYVIIVPVLFNCGAAMVRKTNTKSCQQTSQQGSNDHRKKIRQLTFERCPFLRAKILDSILFPFFFF